MESRAYRNIFSLTDPKEAEAFEGIFKKASRDNDSQMSRDNDSQMGPSTSRDPDDEVTQKLERTLYFMLLLYLVDNSTPWEIVVTAKPMGSRAMALWVREHVKQYLKDLFINVDILLRRRLGKLGFTVPDEVMKPLTVIALERHGGASAESIRLMVETQGERHNSANMTKRRCLCWNWKNDAWEVQLRERM
jgi:hypothetical protein